MTTNQNRVNRYAIFLCLFCLGCGGSTSSEKQPTTETRPISVDSTNSTKDTRQPNIDEVGSLVYVTHDGDKYHTADCRYSKGANQVSLKQAKADGKTACGICKPNSKTGEKQVRCSGTTAEGKQCQRMTTDKSGKCFQHREG